MSKMTVREYVGERVRFVVGIGGSYMLAMLLWTMFHNSHVHTECARIKNDHTVTTKAGEVKKVDGSMSYGTPGLEGLACYRVDD